MASSNTLETLHVLLCWVYTENLKRKPRSPKHFYFLLGLRKLIYKQQSYVTWQLPENSALYLSSWLLKLITSGLFITFSFSIHTLLPQEKIKSFKLIFHITLNVKVFNSSCVKSVNKNIFNVLTFYINKWYWKSGFQLEYCLYYVQSLSGSWIYRCLTSSLSYLFQNRGLFFGSSMSLPE